MIAHTPEHTPAHEDWCGLRYAVDALKRHVHAQGSQNDKAMLVKARAELESLTNPAPETGHISHVAVVEFEQFIQSAIDSAPQPAQRLGKYLADVLSEDQWVIAERMLIAASIVSRTKSREL